MRARISSVWLLSGVFLTASSAAAQTDNDAPRSGLFIDANPPDVVTVLGRTNREAETATSALTVLDRETIETRGDLAVADLLRGVPGAAVSRSGPLSGLAQVRLRGSEANHALVLVNGLDVSNPFAGEADLQHLTTLDIERIEVLRGEQSPLWGSDAIGGVINIVTRDDADDLLDAAFEAGSFGTTRASAAASGDVWPVRGRVAIGYLESDGVDVSGTGGDADGYVNRSLTANGSYDGPNRWWFTGVARATSARSDFDADIDFDGLLDDADRVLDFADAAARLRAERDWSLADDWIGRTAATLAYLDTEQETRADGARSALTEGSRATLAADFGLERGFPGDRFAANLRLEQELERTRNAGATPDAAENQARKTTTRSVALELVAERAGWTADASLRHDANERFADADTWRVGASRDLPRDLGRVYASYGEGVKNPTFFDLYGFFPDFWAGNPDLKPERSKGWNVGLELAPTNALVLSADYFDARLKDEIINDFSVFPATARNLATDSTRRGVELSAHWNASPALAFDASATFLDATENGVAEVRRPDATASFTATWRPLKQHWRAAFGVDYVGETEDLDFSTFPASRATLDAYALARASFGYAIADGVELTLRGENLADADYQDVLGFHTTGAGVYAGLRVRR